MLTVLEEIIGNYWKLGTGRLLPLFPPFSMTWQMPEVVVAESLYFDNI